MPSESVNKAILKISGLSSRIISEVSAAINSGGELENYQTVWKQFEDVAVRTIIKILKEEFPECRITVQKSKSTYPDIKLETEGGVFAIDIKSNESQKNPWFDMARLDTIIPKRIEKYDEEWEFVIKYDSREKKFLRAYFNLFREVAGKAGAGVKYRPYDGKIRPKSWDDFDVNATYWESKEGFLEGVKTAQKARWKKLIRETLVPKLSEEEKKEFRKLFD